jgi:hypothetical protein
MLGDAEQLDRSRPGAQAVSGDPIPWIPLGYMANAPVGSTSVGNRMEYQATEKAPPFAPDVVQGSCAPPPTDFCSSSTTCEFQGLTNIALGSATLSLVGSNLLISNVGGSGNDGVRVLDSGAAASRIFEVQFTHIASPPFPGLFVEILPSFPVGGPVTMKYTAFLNGSPVGLPVMDTLPAHASDWPDSQNFAIVRWAHTISLALPGGSPVTADQLEIIPQTSAFANGAAFMEYRGTSSGGSSLTSLTVTRESFPGSASFCAPAMTGVGGALLVALLLSASIWAMSRRIAA